MRQSESHAPVNSIQFCNAIQLREEPKIVVELCCLC